MAFTSGIPAALQPTQTKTLYSGNYIDFTNTNFDQWTQQFLPDASITLALFKLIFPIFLILLPDKAISIF